jgi:hypothetical protein
MRRGRKRKRGRREPNGRVQRPPVAVRDVRDVVLAQPHRRGSNDPFCESPLGQFVLRHRLDRLCYDAALDFARLTRRVFASKGVPQPHRDGHRTPDNGLGLSAEAARHLQRELEQLEKRLRSISRDGFRGTRQLAIFEREALPEQAQEAMRVLLELAASRAPV